MCSQRLSFLATDHTITLNLHIFSAIPKQVRNDVATLLIDFMVPSLAMLVADLQSSKS